MNDARDEGSALVITLMVMAIVTVLATTVLTVTVNNVSSTRRSLDAATALDAADAGVTQALSYLRKERASTLDCSPTCAANPWGNSAAPYSRTIPGSTRQKYEVWMEKVPATDPAVYRIHSHGMSTKGSRYVQVDAALIPGARRLPLGVFARSIDGGGSASVTRASVFSTGCVYNRSKIDMGTSIDAAYDIRAAVHSASIITDGNGNNSTCPANDSKAIHRSSNCDPAFPYDQDAHSGTGSLASTACAGALTAAPNYYGSKDLDGNGTIDVNGSWIRDAASMMKLWNITNQPLTADQIDDLRVVAKSQGNYWTSTTGWTSPSSTTTPDAVMFFDLSGASAGNREVDLNDITGWGRDPVLDPSSVLCPKRSLLIIIVDGNAQMNSNQQLAASLVLTGTAPYGQVTKANGTGNFIGTVFADHVNLVGNIDFSLDKCFTANLPPGISSVEIQSYRELDR